MRTANDFDLCVSAVKTSMIKKREKIEELTKKWLNTDNESTENKIEKELEFAHWEYSELLKSYNEALEIL